MRQDQAKQDITALLKARNPLLWINSGEELRVERALIGVAQSLRTASGAQMAFRTWDCADGILDGAGNPIENERGDEIGGQYAEPISALDFISRDTQRALYVFRDFHEWLDPMVTRKLRSLARALQKAESDEARAIVVLAPSTEKIPAELANQVTVLDWPLPDREEMTGILDDLVGAVAKSRDAGKFELPDNGARDAAIDAALGLTAEEAANSYSRSLVTERRIDVGVVTAEKKRVIAKERVLTWHDPDPRGLDAVGGLDVLKGWLVGRKSAFSPKAREYGLPAPKGVMLVGPPGTGKSLTAKAIATAWGQPLLRLDLGALKSKFVGDSEANIRKALSVAETVAPCILWVDEIEKALAGSTGPQGDGGVSADALGAILSWMQERAGSVFVVATANDVEALPPELLRKGRFDEVFFIDLPTSVERIEVVHASLRKYGRTPEAVLTNGKTTNAIVARTKGFTGAEIDAMIPDALFRAFSDGEGKRDVTGQDLLDVACSVAPQFATGAGKSIDPRIERLRKWAIERARFASTPEDSNTSVSDGPDRAIEL
jgi:SpoVK/Ycf46/Vps4 family AAA+-type ATPase